MNGLREGWEALPRVRLREETTSASGARRVEAFDAVPLLSALAVPIKKRVVVHAADGLMLALSSEDAARAMLVRTDEGCQLILSGDATRRRRVKNPVRFEVE